MDTTNAAIVFGILVAVTLLLALASQTLLLLGTLEMLRRLNLRTKVRWPGILESPFVRVPQNDEPAGGHVHYPEMDEQEKILAEQKRLREEMEQDEERPTLG